LVLLKVISRIFLEKIISLFEPYAEQQVRHKVKKRQKKNKKSVLLKPSNEKKCMRAAFFSIQGIFLFF